MAVVKAFVSIHRWNPSLDPVLVWVRLVRLNEHSNRSDFSVYWSYYSKSHVMFLFKGPNGNFHLWFICPSSTSRARFDDKEQFTVIWLYLCISKMLDNHAHEGTVYTVPPLRNTIHYNTYVMFRIVRKNTFFFEIFLSKT